MPGDFEARDTAMHRSLSPSCTQALLLLSNIGWPRAPHESDEVRDLAIRKTWKIAGFQHPSPDLNQVLLAGGCISPCGPMRHFEPVALASSIMPWASTVKLIMHLCAR